MYKDAKRLTAAEAAQYGLAEGVIVLVNALAGTPSESSDAVGAGGLGQLQVRFGAPSAIAAHVASFGTVVRPP